MHRWLTWLSLSLLLSCASARPAGPEPMSRPRIKDSAPERIASQRAADRNVGAEADERRWGFDAARERRRKADEARQQEAPGSRPPRQEPRR